MWDSLLKGLGSALSFFYDIIPSWGVAIILLTVAVRLVLLPLTIKQTRSMQAMQRLQPQMKALQQKYKGNKQKLNEELMKLYKEHQVNPLGGCLPLLLQLPVFFALFSVLRSGTPPGVEHLPMGSALLKAVSTQSAGFLGMNLSCAATQAGKTIGELDCGSGIPAYIPFYVLIALMVATTWYQTRQMQASTPSQPRQMQLMGRIMPVFLGVISISIPAGVLVYWVTTNLWQVGQQRIMLKQRAAPPAKPAGAKAVDTPAQDGPKANPKPEAPPARKASRRARNRKKRRKR